MKSHRFRFATLTAWVALLVAASAAIGREFTDVTGRKIQGDLVAHGGGSVEIKVGNATFGIPIDKFTPADQAYIQEWIGKNPRASAFRIRLFTKLTAVPQQTRQKKGDYGDKLKIHPQEYEIVLYNQAQVEMKDAEIRYEIYVNDVVDVQNQNYTNLAFGAQKSDKLQAIPGRMPKQSIPAGGKAAIKRVFTIESYVDRDFGRIDQTAADKVIGIRVRVYLGDQLIAEAGEGIDDKRFPTAGWQDAKEEPKDGAPPK